MTGIGLAIILSAVITDGPYVQYKQDSVRVTYIEKKDDLLQAKTTVYGKSALQVMPEGHPEWQFTVRLRPITIPEPISDPAGPLFFMSDIEGEFAPFRSMLLAGKVIDTAYRWTYGKGSLVIAGDLFDRGKDVVPELWLLYKLEAEATAAGGSVHVILGNHDIMNLSGDHRYTDAKYFKNAWLLHTDCSGLFGKDTELGRWLRSKNTIEKIGPLLVMHGGMSPAVLALHQSIGQLNEASRPYYEVPHYFGRDALFWYRGYFMTPKIDPALVDSTLAQYGCDRIVVGHTITIKNIALYQQGKVVALDVDEHSGHTAAAVYQNGKWQVMDIRGHTRPLLYKPENDQITDDDIL